MEEYKKGDRVRVVSEDGDEAYVGKIGTVIAADRTYGVRWPLRVEFDSPGYDGTTERRYRPQELEPYVDPKIPKGATPVRCVASNSDGLAVFVWSDGMLRFSSESHTLSIGLESLERAVEEARAARETFAKAGVRREAIEFLGIDGTYEEMTDYQKNRVDAIIEIKHGGWV